MNIPNFIRTGAGFTHRTKDSYYLVPEQTEIRLINLPPSKDPYLLMHKTALNNYIITVSYVSKTQDPETLRETIRNHTFFLPLSNMMNDYASKLRKYVGKEGTVNV